MDEQVTITREMTSRLVAMVEDAIIRELREKAPRASTLAELRQLRTDLTASWAPAQSHRASSERRG